MSIVRSCPYDENGELCKYEKYYDEPVYLKLKNGVNYQRGINKYEKI